MITGTQEFIECQQEFWLSTAEIFCLQEFWLSTGKIPVGGYRKILPVNRGTGNFCLSTGTDACQPTRLRSVYPNIP